MTQKDLDSWEGFLGSNFLKAEDVKSENDTFVCKGIEFDSENERPMLVLEKEEITYKYSVNVSNANFLKDAGLKNPKEAIGKKIWFKKVQAYSPTAKKQVDSLRISKVE